MQETLRIYDENDLLDQDMIEEIGNRLVGVDEITDPMEYRKEAGDLLEEVSHYLFNYYRFIEKLLDEGRLDAD